jgi:hypothetical protein
MDEWSFAAIRAVQVWFHTVKTCRTCGNSLPIQKFYLPNDAMYRGYNDCRACIIRRQSESRPVIEKDVA